MGSSSASHCGPCVKSGPSSRLSANGRSAVSEIAVSRCFLDPEIKEELCSPDSTTEQDATKGKWVRVKRNLNLEASYLSGWLVRPDITSHSFVTTSHFPPSRIYTIVEPAGKISSSSQIFSSYPRMNDLLHPMSGRKPRLPSEKGLEPLLCTCGTVSERRRLDCRLRNVATS